MAITHFTLPYKPSSLHTIDYTLGTSRAEEKLNCLQAKSLLSAKCIFFFKYFQHATKHSEKQFLKTDWQTDRQTDRQTDGHTDRQTDRQKDRQTKRQKYRKTDRQKDRQTNRQTDGQTDRQTDRQTDTQTDGKQDQDSGKFAGSPSTNCLRDYEFSSSRAWAAWNYPQPCFTLPSHSGQTSNNRRKIFSGWNISMAVSMSTGCLGIRQPHKSVSFNLPPIVPD